MPATLADIIAKILADDPTGSGAQDAEPPAAAEPSVSAEPPASEGRGAAAAPSARLDRRARRKTAAALREASFEWLADGFTHQEIAAARKVSVAVVRRDIARAIRARQFESRDDHAQLQIARLTKALTLAAARVRRGDLKAIGPLVKVVGALDRYQGGAPSPDAVPARRATAALLAPPLALAHAPAALEDAATEAGLFAAGPEGKADG